jgi:hypothetical protein
MRNYLVTGTKRFSALSLLHDFVCSSTPTFVQSSTIVDLEYDTNLN